MEIHVLGTVYTEKNTEGEILQILKKLQDKFDTEETLLKKAIILKIDVCLRNIRRGVFVVLLLSTKIAQLRFNFIPIMVISSR